MLVTHKLTRELESRLGPDTADLTMRMGLHSGAITGGVLRGEKSRFQLFGDTMNTAARMESNGLPNNIHLSEQTADLLVAAGKANWIVKREDKIVAKGKGELSTWWLNMGGLSKASSQSSGGSGKDSDTNTFDSKTKKLTIEAPSINDRSERLVKWHTDILAGLLQQMVALRGILGSNGSGVNETELKLNSNETYFDVFQEVIEFRDYHAQKKVVVVELPEKVTEQLEEFIRSCANLYNDHPRPFNGFERAS